MSELSILGLSSNEEKLYRELLMLKKSTALNLSKNTGVPQNRVYDYLDKLVKKGFVRLYPGKVKQYLPSPPDDLEKIIEAKKKELEKTHELVKELTNIYKNTKAQPVEFIVGKNNFWKAVKSIPLPEKYSYTIKYSSDYKPILIRMMKKKNVDRKSLARIDEETIANIRKWKKSGLVKIKPINNEGMAMEITDDKTVMITIFGINGTLIIRDTAFAKIMKELFLAKYDNTASVDH